MCVLLEKYIYIYIYILEETKDLDHLTQEIDHMEKVLDEYEKKEDLKRGSIAYVTFKWSYGIVYSILLLYIVGVDCCYCLLFCIIYYKYYIYNIYIYTLYTLY